jgi:hypothetical protein
MLIVAFTCLLSIDLHHKILENNLRPNQRNQFEPKNKKIVLEASSKEINLLIKSYNHGGRTRD